MAEKFEEELEMIIRRKSRQSELENLLRGYRICARSEGKSENTIRATETAITSLGDFLRSNRFSTDAAEIGPHQIRSFILHLGQVRAYAHHPYSRPRERGLSGHTVNSYLRAVRAFFSWLLKEEILSSSPFPRVKVPPAPRKVIPPSPRRSSRRCFRRWTPRSRRGSGAGRWFSPCLTADSGRASWWGLRIEDLNLEEGTLRVYGKGGRERLVPIGARVQRAIWNYLERHRLEPATPMSTTLFLTQGGEAVSISRLDGAIRDCGRKAGIEGVRCSAHTLRHTFAVSYLRNGGTCSRCSGCWGTSNSSRTRWRRCSMA